MTKPKPKGAAIRTKQPSKPRASAAAKAHLRRAHDDLQRALAPVRVRVDVLRLRTHTAGAAKPGPQLAATAELYDEVRTQLDELDRTLDRVSEGLPAVAVKRR